MRTFTIVLFFLLTLMVDNAFSQTEGKSLDLSKIKGGSKSHMKAMGIYGDSPEMILLKLGPKSSEADIYYSLFALGKIDAHYQRDLATCQRAFESIKSIDAMRRHVWKDMKLVGPATMGVGIAAMQNLKGADRMGNAVYVDITFGLTFLKSTVKALPEPDRNKAKKLLLEINTFLIDMGNDDDSINNLTAGAWLGAAKRMIKEGYGGEKLKARMKLVKKRFRSDDADAAGSKNSSEDSELENSE